MKNFWLQFFILPIFILGGFFVSTDSASAVYATTTNPGDVLKDIYGDFLQTDAKLWFDGEYYRFSFTPVRDFYTCWTNYGSSIRIHYYCATWVGSANWFPNGEGMMGGAYFVDNLNDLNGLASGSSVYFLWERGKRYDTYVIQNWYSPISIFGLNYSNTTAGFLENFWPGLKLNPSKSFINLIPRYTTRYVNNAVYAKKYYLDYNYSLKPDPVILIPGILGSWNLGSGWELDPILHTYDNLWSAFKLAGYEEGRDLFAFPYNWRLSNVDSALELKQKIDEVKAICNCDKVDIVAHSMGGLVARAYVEMGDYGNDIGQLVFVAVPHLGAPKDYLLWEGGEVGIGFIDVIRQRIFKLEAELTGYGDVFDYIRKTPIKSVEELLPIYSYLKDGDVLRAYPDNYPRNLFLELLNESSQLAKLNNINVLNITADNNASTTIRYFKVIDKDFMFNHWEHGYPDDFYALFGDNGLEYGVGDGVVPKISNNNFNGFREIQLNSGHNLVVTDAQKAIIKELTGQEPTEEVRKNLGAKYLMVRIFSPADFVVIAPDGKQVGKDFTNSSVINEIDGTFYSGFDSGMEFAVIPDPMDGEYQVKLQGTGDGDYRLSVSMIDDATAIDSEFERTITSGETNNFKITASGNGLSNLEPEIKTLGDLIDIISEMYQNDWITGYGNMTALLARLNNQPMNSQKLEQLLKFLDNMLAKNRLNQRAYAIIKSALTNIYH